MTDLANAIQIIQSTDVPSALRGIAFRFRKVEYFSLDLLVPPHAATLRKTINIDGDYIALASIYINIVRTVSPSSTGIARLYILDETNANVYELRYYSGVVGDNRIVTHFMPIIFSTTNQSKTFRIYTSDSSSGGEVKYDCAGFFAQI